MFDRSILLGDSETVARRLLGCRLVRELDGQTLSGIIVETEAYNQGDAASHSYRGRTPRTDVMFGPPGHLYVYFTYGMHYCCNITVGPEGYGAAVLIRAIEPVEGQDKMLQLRGGRGGYELTNGPAKVCQAFGIDKSWNGHDLTAEPLRLEQLPALPRQQVIQTTRIGITKAVDAPWRFYIKGNPYVSKR